MKHLIGAASLSLACAIASPAAAQDCGNWSRQVVCRAELIARDDERRTIELDARDRLEIAPRSRIELEIDARDQRGSRFPLERLALGYEEYRCDSGFDIEDRGEGRLEIRANASQGRCTLLVWLPNNLNFEWEVEFEIDAGARTNYERHEAEAIVDALYVGILGRDADAGGRSAAIAEVERGNIEAQVDAMIRSPEFQQRSLNLSSEEILESFYQGIFGRSGDGAGVRQYLPDVERRRYAAVVLQMLRSPEFEGRLSR